MIPIETNTSTRVNADLELLLCMEHWRVKLIILIKNKYALK